MNPLLAAWLCWAIVGLSPIAGHYAVGFINPVLLSFLGTILAVLFFAPWLTKQKQWHVLFAKQTRLKFLFIGTFGTALPFSIILWAFHYTTPTNAAILQQSELIYSILIAWIFLREIPTKKTLTAGALILSGVLLILCKEHYTPRWSGDLMIVACPWMFQAASCMAKKLPSQLHHRTIAAARNLYALPVLTLLLLFLMWQKGGNLLCKANFQTTWVLLYTGILKYGWAMILWYQAIRALDLSKVTAIYLSYPVLSFVLSVLLGIEIPHLYQLFGMILTLCGAYWMSFIVQKQQEKKI
ncbi:MAG: DMT family transporter [Elusimicrobiaceae bacterium]|nr:DMT family transporter [Elusimicrobiaceae bacterium]